jgi:hypothetical protein
MKNMYKIFILLFVGCFLMSLGFGKMDTQKPSSQRTISVNISHNLQSDTLVKYDESTGLVVSEHLDLVIANCTGCHSSKLITQFHTDRQGWLEKIRWMQQKQKLWDLGESEPKILDYLAKNYPPSENVSRRAALKNIEWYRLNK